jgi:ubiquitin-conjugating enzyme E2 D
LDIQFPVDYPVILQFIHFKFKPPKIKFVTKIYHPNVFEGGILCLSIFHGQWTPKFTVEKIMDLIQNLLLEPNMRHCFVSEIAYKKRNDPVGFQITAREWTRRFAS